MLTNLNQEKLCLANLKQFTFSSFDPLADRLYQLSFINLGRIKKYQNSFQNITSNLSVM
jgi:hypothetical protein